MKGWLFRIFRVPEQDRSNERVLILARIYGKDIERRTKELAAKAKGSP